MVLNFKIKSIETSEGYLSLKKEKLKSLVKSCMRGLIPQLFNLNANVTNYVSKSSSGKSIKTIIYNYVIKPALKLESVNFIKTVLAKHIMKNNCYNEYTIHT